MKPEDNKVVTALFYLTRACNIDCSYCRIWDNHFPDELTLEQKIHAIDILVHDVGAQFLILFGGEPMVLGDDLVTIVRHMATLSTPYAITSNSILLTKDKARALVDAGLQNWSVSADMLYPEGRKDPIAAKSMKGIRDLEMLKEMGVKDLHATMTITHQNIEHIIPLLHYLNERGIWLEVTALHWSKGEHYYFAPDKRGMEGMMLTEDDLVRIDEIMELLAYMKQGGALIHNEVDFLRSFARSTQASWIGIVKDKARW